MLSLLTICTCSGASITPWTTVWNVTQEWDIMCVCSLVQATQFAGISSVPKAIFTRVLWLHCNQPSVWHHECMHCLHGLTSARICARQAHAQAREPHYNHSTGRLESGSHHCPDCWSATQPARLLQCAHVLPSACDIQHLVLPGLVRRVWRGAGAVCGTDGGPKGQ